MVEHPCCNTNVVIVAVISCRFTMQNFKKHKKNELESEYYEKLDESVWNEWSDRTLKMRT